MNSYVLSFKDIDGSAFPAVGGKGANLGELSKIGGIHVPEFFCVTTEAYKRITLGNPEFDRLLGELIRLKPNDNSRISEISALLRTTIGSTPIPNDLSAAIEASLSTFSKSQAFAIRSSATAEDLPTASFAGQQDSYLNIAGTAAILDHISKCWASLYTDRAVVYRIRNRFDHRQVYLSVIIQKMVSAKASGVMFTADPITGNRKTLSIEAVPGLGEALVSGLVSPDDQSLTEKQILQLTDIGRQIEAHFGYPQDIEWCLAEDTFHIVQSRPITTLYPIPDTSDHENHVYVSVGHQQMMTDPIKPLGLSIFQLTTARPMYTAGGRLFVDVAPDLASPAKRNMLVNVLGKSDPLIKDALTTIIERGDFIKTLPDDDSAKPVLNFQMLADCDPAIVSGLIRHSQESLDELKKAIRLRSGSDLIDFIHEDIQTLRKALADPQSFGVIMTAMNASSWINEKMKEWLGLTNAADPLSQSVPNNITSQMGLELLDLADLIRPYPAIIQYLENVKDDDLLTGLAHLDGGPEARAAIYAYLEKYGMRCGGEIDITRTRWSERPSILAPMILNNIRNAEPNASKHRFEQGRQESLRKEAELLARLANLPDGDAKATETKRMIDLIRNLGGYREYPKYSIVCRYFVYKQALLREAEHLVHADAFRQKEDIYYLSLDELREVIRSNKLDSGIINKRMNDYQRYEKLTPPRIITSDGEIVTGQYNRDALPANAIAGLPVSSGIIEGRARVILNIEDANLKEGDILVTRFTDPSWTPLFLSIKGLVTEVGGLMTHGAVIAREYGLPAVVGVQNATRLIKDGQRIAVNGTDGYIVSLPD